MSPDELLHRNGRDSARLALANGNHTRFGFLVLQPERSPAIPEGRLPGLDPGTVGEISLQEPEIFRFRLNRDDPSLGVVEGKPKGAQADVGPGIHDNPGRGAQAVWDLKFLKHKGFEQDILIRCARSEENFAAMPTKSNGSGLL